LKWFEEKEGHLEIPNQFRMAAGDCAEAGLPSHLTEFRLGRSVGNIRTSGAFIEGHPERRQMPVGLGVRLPPWPRGARRAR